jgi:hypothetical protein
MLRREGYTWNKMLICRLLCLDGYVILKDGMCCLDMERDVYKWNVLLR